MICVLSLAGAGAAGSLAQLRLRSSEFEIEDVHRAWIMQYAVEAFSRFPTENAGVTPLDEDVLKMLIAQDAEPDVAYVCICFIC